MAKKTWRKCSNPNCDMYNKRIPVTLSCTTCRNCGASLVDVPRSGVKKYLWGFLVLVASSVVWWFCLDEVNTQLADIKQLNVSINELKKDNSDLKRQNQEQNQQIKDLEKNNASLEKDNQKMASMISELKTDNSSLKRPNQKQNQRIKDLEKNNASLEKDKQKLEGQKKQLESQIANLEETNSQLSKRQIKSKPINCQKIAECEDPNQDLARKIATLQQQIKWNLQQYEQDKKQSMSRIEELEETNKQLLEQRAKWSVKEKCYIDNKDFSYRGDCQGNLPDGWGIKIFSNGQRYEGKFEKGVMHGCGTLTLPDGVKMENQLWRNGTVAGGTCKNL